MRPDQAIQPVSRAGVGPAPTNIGVFARVVIIAGPAGGLFVYSPTLGKGHLIMSVAAANGTDPYGNAYFAGLATYAPSGGNSLVINLLSTVNDAFFQYNMPSGGVQGGLILAVSSLAGTDPVSATPYPAGLFGIDPVFGDTFQGVGAQIQFNQVAYTKAALIAALTPVDNAHNPLLVVNAPEQTTANHVQVQLQGESPDASRAPQMLVGPVSGATNLTPVSSALAEFQGGTGQIVIQAIPDAATTVLLSSFITTDTFNRYRIRADGLTSWGTGSAALDSALQHLSTGRMGFTTCDVAVHTAGRGLQVAEGSNAKQGTGTLAAGTATIANTSVTASSRIIVTGQPGGANRGGLNVTTITAATSFVVTSTNAADTGNFAYQIFEPG
jgi:hypothetical protein